MISETVTSWATSLGKDPSTIRSAMARAGISFEPDEKFTALVIFNLFTGDKQAAKIRLDTAMAEKVERENRLAEKELCALADVEKIIWDDCLLPLRQSLEALPASVSIQCNPSQPELALTVLQNAVEEIKKQIRLRNEL